MRDLERVGGLTKDRLLSWCGKDGRRLAGWKNFTPGPAPESGGLRLQQLEDRLLLLQDFLLLLEHLKLGHVHGVKRGQGDVIGFGACVLAGRDDVLADDDDRQQDQLEE